MKNPSSHVLDEAQALPVWEFMADATPEKIGYVMACYIDSLIQKGMTAGDAAFEAMNVTMEAIASAASDVTGESPLRAGTLAIPDTTGEVQYDFEYCYNEDGAWHTVLFEDLDDARDFATAALSRNESNERFMSYARRIVQVDTCDFYDHSIPPTKVRVIQNHEDL